MRVAVVGLLAAVLGCSGGPLPDGPDAGSSADSGVAGDAGAFDGGHAVDAGGPAGGDAGSTCPQLLGSLYEPFETRCDGVDNDCNGVIDVSEPRLVAEGWGDYLVTTMGMDVVELSDGTLLGAWNRGLQHLTPTFADAGFELVPWTDVAVSGGYTHFHPIRGGYLLRTFGYAGSELRWINLDGSPRSLPDGGWKFWANDGGLTLFTAAELDSGDLVASFRDQGFDPPRALMLIPSDGGRAVLGLDAGLLFGDLVVTTGNRILATEGEYQGGGWVFRVVEFDSALRKTAAGAWIGPATQNADATLIRSPLPNGVGDGRIAISGYTSTAPQQVRRARSGEDGGAVWLPWSLHEFDIATGPRGNAVISARSDSIDANTVIARLESGPVVQLVADGGLAHLPHRRWNHLAALADGGFVATFTAEDAGTSSNFARKRFVYAVRLCLSADSGVTP